MYKNNRFFRKPNRIFLCLLTGSLTLGFFSTNAFADYTVSVTKSVLTPGVKEKYTFKYYLNGVLNSGFSCYCQASGGATQWVGGGIDTCSGISAASKVVSVSGLGVTTGACCKSQPKVDAALPQPPVNPGPSCW